MENKHYNIILSGANMGFGDMIDCVNGSSNGEVEAIFGDEECSESVDELAIKCQITNAKIYIEKVDFQEIRIGVDVKRLLMIYVAKQQRTGLLSHLGKKTVAEAACELQPGRDFIASNPDLYINHVLQEAERLGNKFGMTVRVEYFGDPHYARAFL